MYAVLKHGGKQYKVKEGEVVLLNKIDALPSTKLDLGEVILLKDEEVILDKEQLSKAKVQVTLLEHLKGEKVVAFKYKPKKGYKRKKGYRQLLTKVRVDKIVFGEEKLPPQEVKESKIEVTKAIKITTKKVKKESTPKSANKTKEVK